MYDPTVFENLKVAFENRIYDLDTIEHRINIVNRADLLDLAVLKRQFSIEFALVFNPKIAVEVMLDAPLKELADEILEAKGAEPGCMLSLRVRKHLEEPETQCAIIASVLELIWEDDVECSQTLSYRYGEDEKNMLDTIEVRFKKKLTEEQMGDIAPFLEFVLEMLVQLGEV